MNNRKPAAVVFDMDGVIFDSERLILDIWDEIAEKYHIDDFREACLRCLGVNRATAERICLDKYGEDFPYDTYKKELSAIFHMRYDGGRLPVKKGVREILEALKEAGIPLAIASSTREAVVKQEISDAGLLAYFDKIICGDMVTHSKPHPQIFLRACEELGVCPRETVAFEDSFNGIRSAAAGGLRAIMIPDILQPTEEIRGLAEIVLPDLLAARDYLLGE